MKAYEGQGKYIFISYSHKDEKNVFPVIEKLQEQYNVWFDKEGIKYSDKYDNVIANHIANCELFIFMVSKNSLTSEYCEFEINLAERKKRPFFNVLIEDCLDLPEADIFAARYYKKYHLAFLYKTEIDAFVKELPTNYPDIIKCQKEQKVETKVVATNSVQTQKPHVINNEPTKKPVTENPAAQQKVVTQEPANTNPLAVRANLKMKEINRLLENRQIDNIKCISFTLSKEYVVYRFECPLSYTRQNFSKVCLTLQQDIEFPISSIVELATPPSTEHIYFGFMISKYFLNRIEFEEVYKYSSEAGLPPLSVAFGLTRGNEPTLLDLAKLNHMLVAGDNEKERNNFLNGIIATLLKRNSSKNLKLALLNFDEKEAKRYENLPHLFGKPNRPNDIPNVLGELYFEIKKRIESMKHNDDIVLIVKDYDKLITMFTQNYALIDFILQNGRRYGVFVIFSAREVGVSRLTTLINSYMTTHVTFSTSSLGYRFEEETMMLRVPNVFIDALYVKTPHVLNITMDEIVKTAIEKEKQ